MCSGNRTAHKCRSKDTYRLKPEEVMHRTPHRGFPERL
jgi:hypothetical protein